VVFDQSVASSAALLSLSGGYPLAQTVSDESLSAAPLRTIGRSCIGHAASARLNIAINVTPHKTNI
jgi:hypothetical protein